MRLLCNIIVVMIAVTLSVGCSSKMAVSTVGGIKKAATNAFKVTALSKIVTAPGEVLTLTGSGFRLTLSLAQISGLNLSDTSGQSVTAQLAVQSSDKATVTLPSSMTFGKHALTLTQDGESQQITLFSNGGKTDYPVFTAGTDKICAGDKFYDETGSLREGTKICNLPLPECREDGAKACTATSAYPAAAATGLADKVVSGQTVAGIAGNFTAPSPTKVHVNNGPFGVAGSSLTPTLADCAIDGGTNCVANAYYTAAATSGLAAKVVSGITVAGILGSATAESHSNCAADGATGCVSVPNYIAAATTGLASKVLSSSTVAGVAGNVTLPTVGNVLTGISFGIGGTASTGTLTLPAASNVLASNGAYGVSGSGTTPTLTLPDVANVRVSNGSFGVGGNSSTPTLADCSTDGGIGCVSVGPNYAAVVTTGLAAKVIAGSTVAGVSGSAISESHSNCTSDGAVGCISVANYTAAATSGLASKVLSTSTVAGIAGNVTLPVEGKVYTGIQYGVSGMGLTGTLTIPLASNVISGSPTYGDPGAPVTPSLASAIYVRPASPTITATAFNFSPDRISLTWNAVSVASGYLVLMNTSAPVTWTPSDFTTYTSGPAGSDSIALMGSGTFVNPPIPMEFTRIHGISFGFGDARSVSNSQNSSSPFLPCWL